jgi:hypothetical protein
VAAQLHLATGSEPAEFVIAGMVITHNAVPRAVVRNLVPRNFVPRNQEGGLGKIIFGCDLTEAVVI